jgi:hypothetical protein
LPVKAVPGGEAVIMTVSDDDTLRLIAVIDQQRRALDRVRAEAAEQSVVAMARGALMERLGLSSAEAASQLAGLSAATGIPLAEMAAAVLSPKSPAGAARDAGAPAAAGTGASATAEQTGFAGDVAAEARGSRPRLLMIEAAAELAADGAELAGSLAEQVLGPLGASAVVLWLLEADGALTLLGEAGLSGGEASRWRHIPPQLDCPAQRVACGAANLWWPAGRPEGDRSPVIARADGARAVLALRERKGDLLGVLEASWLAPLGSFGDEARQQLRALADGCARVLAARLPHGHLAAAQPKAAVYTLLDDLTDSVLVAQAIRDDAGRVADFSIEHVSPGFRDAEGRTAADLTRLTLLEAYPAGVSGRGLFARALQVLADGVPQHVPGPLSESLASGLIQTEVPADDDRAPAGRSARGPVLRRRDRHLARRRVAGPPGRAHRSRPAARPSRRLGGEPGHRAGALDHLGVRAVRPGPPAGDGNPARGSAQLRDGG